MSWSKIAKNREQKNTFFQSKIQVFKKKTFCCVSPINLTISSLLFHCVECRTQQRGLIHKFPRCIFSQNCSRNVAGHELTHKSNFSDNLHDFFLTFSTNSTGKTTKTRIQFFLAMSKILIILIYCRTTKLYIFGSRNTHYTSPLDS